MAKSNYLRAQKTERALRSTFQKAHKQPFDVLAALFDQQAADMLNKAEEAREKNTDPVVGEALYQWHEGYSRGLTYAAEQIRLNLGLQASAIEQVTKSAEENALLADTDDDVQQ